MQSLGLELSLSTDGPLPKMGLETSTLQQQQQLLLPTTDATRAHLTFKPLPHTPFTQTQTPPSPTLTLLSQKQTSNNIYADPWRTNYKYVWCMCNKFNYFQYLPIGL